MNRIKSNTAMLCNSSFRDNHHSKKDIKNMFSNTCEHLQTTPLVLNDGCFLYGVSTSRILTKKSAFLLHTNHVLDLKNSKLHKHHLSLSLS